MRWLGRLGREVDVDYDPKLAKGAVEGGLDTAIACRRPTKRELEGDELSPQRRGRSAAGRAPSGADAPPTPPCPGCRCHHV